MVLFVGAHRPDRKPVFRFSGFSVFWVFRSSGCSAGRVCRDSGRAAGRVCRTTGDSESRFAAFPGSGSDSGFCSGFGRGCGEELLFRTSSAPDAPGPPSGAVRDPAAGCFGCSLRASAAHLLFRMPSGDRLPIPPRGVACFSPSRRRQRLSPLPEIRWRCMRERSLSTFICATSSSS